MTNRKDLITMTDLGKTNRIRDAALAYASKGFGVIPISASSKRPLIKFADLPNLTAEQIKQIWTKWPDANLALRTQRFFVVDVDSHKDKETGKTGMQSIKDLHHDEWFANTLCEKTAHGGYHFYFAKPAKVEIKQNIGWLPSVDIKAHVNNYVVCSPSVIDGKPYEFINHRPMMAPPKGLLQKLLNDQMPSLTPLQAIEGYRMTNGSTKTAKLFSTIANGLGDTGGRNNALTQFAGGLLYRGVEPEDVAALAVIANDNTPDPLPEKELRATLNSMIEKEIRRRANMTA